MSIVRALRLLGTIEDGNLSAAQLETALASNATKSDLNTLLNISSLDDRIFNNTITSGVLVGSATAFAKAWDYGKSFDIFKTAVIASTTALTVVAASFEKTKDLLNGYGYDYSRYALWNSDTALTILGASTNAKDAMRAAVSGYETKTVALGSSATASTKITGRYIMVDVSADGGSTLDFTGRRSNSTLGVISNFNPDDVALPGTFNIIPFEATAEIHNDSTSAINAYIGYIPATYEV